MVFFGADYYFSVGTRCFFREPLKIPHHRKMVQSLRQSRAIVPFPRERSQVHAKLGFSELPLWFGFSWESSCGNPRTQKTAPPARTGDLLLVLLLKQLCLSQPCFGALSPFSRDSSVCKSKKCSFSCTGVQTTSSPTAIWASGSRRTMNWCLPVFR